LADPESYYGEPGNGDASRGIRINAGRLLAEYIIIVGIKGIIVVLLPMKTTAH
jgi:hypothetical protein